MLLAMLASGKVHLTAQTDEQFNLM